MTTSPRNVLILRGGALGDFVLTLPVLQSLRRCWPAARLHLAARSPARSLAVRCGLADQASDLESSRWTWLFDAQPSSANEAPYADVVVNFLHDPDLIVAGNLARRYELAVHAGMSPILPANQTRHAADAFVTSLKTLGIADPERLPCLTLPAEDREDGRNLAAAWGGKIAMIQPGSGSPAKNWPLARFVKLARLIEATGVKTFFLLGEAEADLREMVGSVWAPGQVLADLDLEAVARWLAASRLYVGNDSGVTHLAAALGTPVVALFGPTDPAVWQPRGGGRIAIVRAPGGRMAALEQEAAWAAVLPLAVRG